MKKKTKTILSVILLSVFFVILTLNLIVVSTVIGIEYITWWLIFVYFLSFISFFFLKTKKKFLIPLWIALLIFWSTYVARSMDAPLCDYNIKRLQSSCSCTWIKTYLLWGTTCIGKRTQCMYYWSWKQEIDCALLDYEYLMKN